ncbi:hypothetical protein MJA45_12900 [Paenibacillus aurantius]|uniref:Uncharacterized protein n=1 Tax=Paenibacillus aurantius TaxID=2918900 RepID=A0AA96RHS9_9BACL|nr:hypothetical protein [Paenibacillus aurantius]WNQ13871.1 hypothetical protein MJA45_12900 [Paenibacillus aurantius]
MDPFEKSRDTLDQAGKRDNPEQFPTEKESLLDQFKSEQNVDSIPLEDLNMEQKEEKQNTKTKNNSSSEQKYKKG